MTEVKYKVLKSNIVKACKGVKGNKGPLAFRIDFNRLYELVEDTNLIPFCVDLESRPVQTTDIPQMMEYWNKAHMLWLSKAMHTTTLCFLDAEFNDEKSMELLAKLQTPQVDDPDLDKVKVYAELVSNYPCYFATIVSYANNAPGKFNRPFYEIACRANKVTIRQSDYKYYHGDF